jgi:hypothetical protein
MGRLILLLSALYTVGCSVSYELRCRQLQDAGQIQATLGSCVECVRQFGGGSAEMLNGCALGLDAANLVAR